MTGYYPRDETWTYVKFIKFNEIHTASCRPATKPEGSYKGQTALPRGQ